MERQTLMGRLVRNRVLLNASFSQAVAIIINALGAAATFKNPYAPRPTRPRARWRSGRGVVGHRLRKAKRMTPATILRVVDHRSPYLKHRAV